MTTMTEPTTTRSSAARRWLWTGAVLTVLVTVASVVASPVITQHVQAGYPSLSDAELGAATTTYVTILISLGALGLLGWLGTLWASRSGARWAPWLASLLFLGALGVALIGLTLQDTSGDVGLAPLQGWLQVVPIVAGAFAVAALWRRR